MTLKKNVKRIIDLVKLNFIKCMGMLCSYESACQIARYEPSEKSQDKTVTHQQILRYTSLTGQSASGLTSLFEDRHVTLRDSRLLDLPNDGKKNRK